MSGRRRGWRSGAAALLIGLTVAVAGSAAGGDMLSPNAYERVIKIQKSLDAGEHDRARGLAQVALSKKSSRGYERAITLQLLSHSFAALGDYPAAAAALEQALALNVFGAKLEHVAQFGLARLFVAAEEWDQGLRILEVWFEGAERPGPEAHMLLAQIHAQKEEYVEALVPARTAVRLSERPREDWYRFLTALHYEVGDIAAMTDVLRSMVILWPQQGRYWRRLAGGYETLGNQTSARAVLELADKQNLLTEESEFIHLARLYLQQGVPVRAARIIRTGLEKKIIRGSVENWTLLADALAQSDDRAASIQALESAVKMTGGSALHSRLAQAYLADEEWQAAARVAKSGLAVDGATARGGLSLILGIAHYRSGKIGDARIAFDIAARDAETKTGAEQWIALLPARRENPPGGGDPVSPRPDP